MNINRSVISSKCVPKKALILYQIYIIIIYNLKIMKVNICSTQQKNMLNLILKMTECTQTVRTDQNYCVSSTKLNTASTMSSFFCLSFLIIYTNLSKIRGKILQQIFMTNFTKRRNWKHILGIQCFFLLYTCIYILGFVY